MCDLSNNPAASTNERPKPWWTAFLFLAFAATLAALLWQIPPNQGSGRTAVSVNGTKAEVTEVQQLQTELARAQLTIELQRQAIVQLQRQVANQRPAENAPVKFNVTPWMFLVYGISAVVTMCVIGSWLLLDRRNRRRGEREKRGLELPPPPPGPLPE